VQTKVGFFAWIVSFRGSYGGFCFKKSLLTGKKSQEIPEIINQYISKKQKNPKLNFPSKFQEKNSQAKKLNERKIETQKKISLSIFLKFFFSISKEKSNQFQEKRKVKWKIFLYQQFSLFSEERKMEIQFVGNVYGLLFGRLF
jgi:hypothetical protein